MMQVAGKSNSTVTKILSIQLQLGGLSFYCGEEGKFIFRQLKEEGKYSAGSIISNEILLDSYDLINFFSNTLDFVIIPVALFDENMCEAYLQAKSIEIKENSEIKYSLRDDVVYISVIDKDILPKMDFAIDFFPLIAKLFTFANTYETNSIYFAILDDILHLCCSLDDKIILCESYPLISSSDVEFYISMVKNRYYNNKAHDLVLLYNEGDFAFEPTTLKRLRVKNIVKESFFEL